MKIRNQTMIVTTLALAGLMSACATTAPPPQLLEARIDVHVFQQRTHRQAEPHRAL